MVRSDDDKQHYSTDHLLSDLKGRTVSGAIITLVAQAAQFALMMLTTVVLARLLLPADFGLVAMVGAFLGFFRIFREAGLSVATVQRQDITHAQVSNLFWINAALSATAGVVVAASAPAIAWFYREPRLVDITLALAITFLFSGLAVQHTALLNRQMRFKAIALIQVVAALAGAAVGIVMALLNCGYWSLVGLQIGSPLAALLITWSVSGWRPQLPARGSRIKELLHFGANLTATSLIYSFARGLDSVLIGRTYGARAVGLYSRALALLIRPLDQFMPPIHGVLVPILSRLQAQPQRYRKTYLQLYEAVALVSFLFTSLLLVLANPITLVVLGPQWQDAAPIFAGLALTALSYPLTDAATWLFTSQGRGKDFLINTIICSAAAVSGFLIGLPFGATGVAIALSATSILFVMPIQFYVAGRRGPVSTMDLWRVFYRHLPVWIVVCGATYAIRTLVIDQAPWVQLIVCAPIGLLAGCAFIFMYPPARRTALSLVGAFAVLKSGPAARPT